MDLGQTLKDKKKSEKKKESSELIIKHKKPNELKDIESRSNNNRETSSNSSEKDINNFLDNEKKLIYFKDWNKLDIGYKLNRLRNFTEKIKKEKNLSNVEQLENLVIDACNKGKLNKNSDVLYDKDKGEIISLKNLNCDDNNFFTLKIVEKKTKSTPKSKTNIDRFLKANTSKKKK